MVIDDMCKYMRDMANDNAHGYSQAVRSLYAENPTSFDCSSLILTAIYYAFKANGLDKEAEYVRTHCSYTGNMYLLANVGFYPVKLNPKNRDGMKAGDIYLNARYHVCMAVDEINICHARSSEGTKDTRDNSGNEICIQPWYMYSHGWDMVLRYVGESDFKKGSDTYMFELKTLCMGDKGKDVKLLQQLLIVNGYTCGKWAADGDFGEATRLATLNYQRSRELEPDGIVGRITWASLLLRS